MEIKLLEIAGIRSAIKAMRLPKRSGEKSDSENSVYFTHDYHNGNVIGSESEWYIGPNDMKLAQTLIKAGSEHCKALRGIIAWIETTAPWYWFNELDTYVVGRVPMGSTSSMHIDCKGLTGEELQKAKGAIRGDYEYTRIWAMGYMGLRNMYKQRRTHRLPEWQQFCDFIETLPLSKELVLI